MKPTGLVSTVLLLLLGVGLGVVLDRALLAPTPQASNATLIEPSAPKKLPAVARPPASRTNAIPPEIEPVQPPVSAEEFTSAFTAALSERNSEIRLNKLVELAERLPPADVPKVIGLFEQLGRRDERDVFLTTLLNRWANADVSMALRFAQQLHRPAERRAATSAVLEV